MSKPTKPPIKNSVIKHIVIGGGGTTGFMTLGALKCLQENAFWDIANIKTIYGTSIGSIVATSLALKYDWDTLLNYFIHRPWNKLYAYNKSDVVLNLYNQKGVFKSSIFEKTIHPLLEGRGLSRDTTMKEMFEYSNIDLHFFSLELNSMTKTNISHKTHPDLKLADAIYMSSACPILFAPLIDDRTKSCYVDGGLICNYAVNECIENEKCELDEILGMRNIFEHYVNPVTDATSVFEYLTSIYKQVTMYALNEHSYQQIPHEVVCITDNSGTDFVRWIDALKSDNILALINKGEMYARLFMKYKGYKTIVETTQCGTKLMAPGSGASESRSDVVVFESDPEFDGHEQQQQQQQQDSRLNPSLDPGQGLVNSVPAASEQTDSRALP
jgi:predicted acylesterase/phospholipase RssA